MSENDLRDTIRRRIVADLHLGKVKPGGRLPSLRDVARELNVSIRAAARAYGELEKEGLVTVRGRSGIYLVVPQTVEVTLSEPLDWYAEMLRDAWQRRLPITEISNTLSELVQNPTRVACVESTEDHMQAFCAELEEDFALETKSVKLTDEGARVSGESVTLYDALSDVDFAVTTAFHASEVRLAADVLQKPVVIVSVNETLVTALEEQVREGSVTVVADDPVFVERFRGYLLESFQQAGDMRIVLYDDVLEDPELLAGTTPLYTRAARKRMNEQEYHLLPPPVPFLSASAARKIVQCMLAAHGKRLLREAA